MAEHRPARMRNIVIFVVGVLLLGNIFGLYFDVLDGFGEMAFILSPIVLALALRTFAGDGWADAGFGLHLRGNLGIYAFASLLYPVLMGGALGLGVLSGDVVFQPGARPALVGAMLVSIPAVFAFAFFEEVGWRGYLEPRLAAFGVPAPRRHFFVALVWAPWHLGYIFSHPENYSNVWLPLLLILTLVTIGAMSVIYGVTRTMTASLWPAVIAHAMGNLIAWPMLDGGHVTIETPLLFAARTDSLLVLAALLVIAGFALRWNLGRTTRAEPITGG